MARSNSHPVSPTPALQEAAALRAFASMLVRRRWTLFCVVAICVGLGAAYLKVAQPLHKVTARLLVQPQQPHGIEPRLRPAVMEKDFIATQAEIARSPTVVERAVAKYALAGPDGPEVDPVVSIASGLSITPVMGTNVLTVSFQSPDASEGLRTVESVIASYREYLCGIEHDSHLETLTLLTRNEKELRDELKGLEVAYRDLREKSSLMGQGKEAGAVNTALLTHLGQTLSETKNRRIGLENHLRAASTARGERPATRQASAPAVSGQFLANTPGAVHTVALRPIEQPAATILPVDLPASPRGTAQAGRTTAAVATQEEIATIEAELAKARVREGELAQSLGPKHPDLRAVREQILTWQKVLAAKMEAIPAILERDLSVIRMYEAELAGTYDVEFRKAKEADTLLLKEQQALDEIQRVRTIHDSILTQLKQRQIADEALTSGRSVVTVNVLEAPVVAEQPTWPPSPFLVIAACALVGLTGGIGLLSLIDRAEEESQAVVAKLDHELLLSVEPTSGNGTPGSSKHLTGAV